MHDLIRVSDVLKLLFPYSLDFVDQADLDRGSKCHFAMECFINDRLHGFPPTIIPEITPLVDWLDKEAVECEAAEERVHHAYGYCGQPDLVGIWHGEPCVFDYKFAESLNKQNYMQLEAYRQMFTPKRKAILLQCPKAGTVTPLYCKPNPSLWSAFLCGLGTIKFHRAQVPKRLTPEQFETLKTEAQEIVCQMEK